MRVDTSGEAYQSYALSVVPWRGHLGGLDVAVVQGQLTSLVSTLTAASRQLRAAVLSAPSAASSGLLARVVGSMAAEPNVVLQGIHGHPRVQDIEAGAARILASGGADLLLTVGGGSVADFAKAVNLVISEGEPIAIHDGRASADSTQSCYHQTSFAAMVAIPTTLSAAELTPAGSAIRADGRKIRFRDARLAASAVVYDTQVLSSTPPRTLAGSAFNALSHSIEGLYSPTRTPVTDALAQRSIALLTAGLGTAPINQPRQLLQLATGSAMSGFVVSHARTGLQHAICHALGARPGLAHGDAHCVMLPYTLAFNFARAPGGCSDAIASIGRSAESAIATLKQLRRGLSLPERLRDLAVKRGELALIARDVMLESGTQRNIQPIRNVNDITDILTAAW